MIFDSLDHRDSYKGIPGLIEILDAMADIHIDTMPAGKMIIDGDNAFINPVSFTSKPLSDTRYEAHQRYADIHCVIEGTEEIIVTNIREVKEIEPYSSEHDIGFYQADHGTTCILRPGDFLVCFPQDAHRVAIAPDQPAPITKVVGKLKVD